MKFTLDELKDDNFNIINSDTYILIASNKKIDENHRYIIDNKRSLISEISSIKNDGWEN